MEIRNNGLYPNKIKHAYSQTSFDDQSNSFKNILDKKVNEEKKIQFSKHANIRLGERSLNLTTNQMERVQSGVEEAKNKGIKESLVLVDNIALIVSVKNNTVITATNNNNKNVFTNIDGAVIV